jgi:hypothetical protein
LPPKKEKKKKKKKKTHPKWGEGEGGWGGGEGECNSLNCEREKTGIPIVVCQTCLKWAIFLGGNKYIKFLL